MDNEFHLGFYLIAVKNHRISDFGKIPQQFHNFLKTLNNIRGIEVYENGGMTFIISPPDNWKGDPMVNILCIKDEKKFEERLKPYHGRRNRSK